MDSINKTLYIPLYGKAYVSKRNIVIQDKKAEVIWEKAGFELKGKSKSKWLAYYMAMRAAIYDEWVKREIGNHPDAVVLHIGCGLDSRIERVAAKDTQWYDIDFPEVIEERKKFYAETVCYHMVPADMRNPEWKNSVESNRDAIVILEGVSMYFRREELVGLLSELCDHFKTVRLLMDCYTERAAKVSKYKNPINDVGVTAVYGYDDPQELGAESGLVFEKEYSMTPRKYVDALQGLERTIFKTLFAGRVANSMYRMYGFRKG